MPTCIICHKAPASLRKASRGYNKTCDNPECRRELKRRVGVEQRDAQRAKLITVTCLRCDDEFKTTKDRQGLPLHRICEECRRVNLEFRSFAEAWG